MTEKYKGFNTFPDMKNSSLQAYNRYVMIMNIKDQHGLAVSNDYAKQFTQADLLSIYAVAVYANDKGLEQAKKKAIRGE